MAPRRSADRPEPPASTPAGAGDGAGGAARAAAGARPRPPLRRQLRNAGGLVLLALAVTVAAVALTRLIPRPQSALLGAGTMAPAIRLADADGRQLDALALAAGRPLVVEFFESSCQHCRDEVPAMCAIARDHPRAAVVAVDVQQDGADALRRFQRDQGGGCIAFPLLLDASDRSQQVYPRYGVGEVPTVYVIDGSGRVAYSGVGHDGVAGVSGALARLGAG